jgi:putative hydrolase of the HAD superfamily
MKTLILDLDDTVFRTRSMDPGAFEPFFKHLKNGLRNNFDTETITAIEQDLWHMTWDQVMRKHLVPAELMTASIKLFDDLPELNISTYPDYHRIKELPYPKFLVTSSVANLQRHKIKALGIENDFEKIVIIDPFQTGSNKKNEFETLMTDYDLLPAKTFVIGDNADSEIKAGNELGMITIQVLAEGGKKGEASYHVNCLGEIPDLIG